jgi:hypothetical protein
MLARYHNGERRPAGGRGAADSHDAEGGVGQEKKSTDEGLIDKSD